MGSGHTQSHSMSVVTHSLVTLSDSHSQSQSHVFAPNDSLTDCECDTQLTVTLTAQ